MEQTKNMRVVEDFELTRHEEVTFLKWKGTGSPK